MSSHMWVSVTQDVQWCKNCGSLEITQGDHVYQNNPAIKTRKCGSEDQYGWRDGRPPKSTRFCLVTYEGNTRPAYVTQGGTTVVMMDDMRRVVPGRKIKYMKLPTPYNGGQVTK